LRTLSLAELRFALDRCRELTGVTDFVIVGSQAILGSFPDASVALRTSQDIDLFVRRGATAEVNKLIYAKFGPESEFERQEGFYIEPMGEWVMMTSLPGWQERLVKVEAPGGAVGWCLSPLDIAYNKAEAGREKDIAYLTEMFRSGIVRPSEIKTAMNAAKTAPDAAVIVDERVQEAIRRNTHAGS